MRKKENAHSVNEESITLSEFILILRDTIKANIKLRHFLNENKREGFLLEDCFFTVDANIKDLQETYKEACAEITINGKAKGKNV